jgi:hypothetical protein
MGAASATTIISPKKRASAVPANTITRDCAAMTIPAAPASPWTSHSPLSTQIEGATAHRRLAAV